MAKSAAKVAAKDVEASKEADAPEKDSPLLDLSDAGVKKMIKAGKTRGYVTFDELNAVLPQEQNSSEQIEDVLATLSDMGITVVESEVVEDGQGEAVEEVAAAGQEEGNG